MRKKIIKKKLIIAAILLIVGLILIGIPQYRVHKRNKIITKQTCIVEKEGDLVATNCPAKPPKKVEQIVMVMGIETILCLSFLIIKKPYNRVKIFGVLAFVLAAFLSFTYPTCIGIIMAVFAITVVVVEMVCVFKGLF